MGLPASQRRALSRIEKTLADDHPGLGPLFAVFTGMTGDEAMPVTERVTGRPWRRQRRMWPARVIVAGLAMATAALLALSLMLPRPQVCAPGTVTPVAAHTRSVPTGPQPACATQQNKPAPSARLSAAVMDPSGIGCFPNGIRHG